MRSPQRRSTAFGSLRGFGGIDLACGPCSRLARRVGRRQDVAAIVDNSTENLREYLEARGLSQESFAEVLGVHRTYMGGIERGERNLTLKSVERISARIDVTPLELLKSSRRSG